MERNESTHQQKMKKKKYHTEHHRTKGHKVKITHLCNAHELIVVVRSVKEWFLLEDHTGKHTAQRPHIKRIVVLLKVHEQFGTFEVARRHTHVVFLAFTK